MASPALRAASSARSSSSTFAALPTVSGGMATSLTRWLGWRVSAHDAGTAAALARRGSGGLGRREQPGLAQVGRVGVARGLALDHPDAGAAVPAGGDLLDLAVVQVGRRRPLVLDVDLREVGTGPQTSSEHPLDDVGVDHVGHGVRAYRGGATRSCPHPDGCGPGQPVRSPLRTGWPVTSVARLRARAAVAADPTALGDEASQTTAAERYGRRANQSSEPSAARASSPIAPPTNQPLTSFCTGSLVRVRPRSWYTWRSSSEL